MRKNVPNFYRIKAYENDTLLSDLFSLANDAYSDGNEFDLRLFYNFSEGKNVKLQLMSIDENTYNYFQEVASSVGDGFNASTPFNPEGNFDQDAIGLFWHLPLIRKRNTALTRQ